MTLVFGLSVMSSPVMSSAVENVDDPNRVVVEVATTRRMGESL